MKEDYTEINSVRLFCRSLPLGSLVFTVEVMVHTCLCSDLLAVDQECSFAHK